MNLFNPRLGALLESYSTRPEVAQTGLYRLQQMDQQAAAEQEAMQRATEAKQQVFGRLLENAIDNGADEDTLQKLGLAAGIDARGMGLSTIGGQDPRLKRAEQASKFVSKYDPMSVEEWVNTGNYSSLRPVRTPVRGVSLPPQGQLVDPTTGAVMAENTNQRTRPTASRAPGVQEQRMNALMKEADDLESSVADSESISSAVTKANAAIVRGQALGKYGTGEAASRRKSIGELTQAATVIDNSIQTVMDVLNENPTALTTGGTAARAISIFGKNVEGLANLVRDRDAITFGESKWGARAERYGAKNAAARSALYGLAIMSAIADGLGGGKLSNQQIELQMQNIGANANDPQFVRQRMVELRRRVRDRLEVRLSQEVGDYSALDAPDPTVTETRTAPPEGVDPEDWADMTPEQRALWK